MRIAILGFGKVGRALGLRWAERGHAVSFGALEPNGEEFQQFMQRASPLGAQGLGIPDSVAASELVLLAIPFDAALGWVETAGDLGHRIIVDCTNALDERLQLIRPAEGSGAQAIAARMTGGRLVKAFNCIGFSTMSDSHYPQYGSAQPLDLICGDDSRAKLEVATLSREIGFEAFDLGPLSHAGYLEAMAMVSIQLAVSGRIPGDFAFSLLQR